MKKILIILLFLCVGIKAQSIKDAGNSTRTTLDSAATFTGTYKLVTGYSSISVNVLSDSSGTVEIQFGELISNTFTPVKYYFSSYLAGDSTFTRYYPIDAPYYRVKYTSLADTQHTFILTAMLNQESVVAVDFLGTPKTTVNNATTSISNSITIGSGSTGSIDLSAHTKTWCKVTISSDSTLEYSFLSTFADATTITGGTSVTIPPYSENSIEPGILPTLYIRKSGTAAEVTLTYVLWGR